MSTDVIIPNPFVSESVLTHGANTTNGSDSAPESMDSLFDKEVDASEAEAVTKRNAPPAGTYITEPDEYRPSVTGSKLAEKALDGTLTGETRNMISIFARATAKVKGEEVTQVIRFNMSPDERFKKIYNGSTWTGEYDPKKNDIATRLWANAVQAYEEFVGKGTKFKQSDVIEFIQFVPVALRTMQGDRGELVVLSLTGRGRRNRG